MLKHTRVNKQLMKTEEETETKQWVPCTLLTILQFFQEESVCFFSICAILQKKKKSSPFCSGYSASFELVT